jgi:hypothetical protein
MPRWHFRTRPLNDLFLARPGIAGKLSSVATTPHFLVGVALWQQLEYLGSKRGSVVLIS